MLIEDVLLIAICSALITVVFVALFVAFIVAPRFSKRIEQAREDIAQHVEERIRQRLIEDFSPVAREIVKGSAKNAAQSGVDILEVMVQRLKNSKRSRLDKREP